MALKFIYRSYVQAKEPLVFDCNKYSIVECKGTLIKLTLMLPRFPKFDAFKGQNKVVTR